MKQDPKDHYEILGVSRSNSFAEMKKAYRRLARQCHPDYHPGNKVAEERFKAVSEAYKILKARHDTSGVPHEEVHATEAGPVDDYDMDSYDVYAAPKDPSAKEVLEKAIRELNAAYSAFRNRVLNLEGTLIPNAMDAYQRTGRARFAEDSLSGGSAGFLKNIFESATSKENRARAEQIRVEDNAVHLEARRILRGYEDNNDAAKDDISVQFLELQGDAGKCMRKKVPAPALLLNGMAGLKRVLDYHSNCIDTALDTLRCPKKNDNQTYTPGM